MKKLFISQPMNGLTDDEIESSRKNLINLAKETCGEDVEVIDSFFKDAPHDTKPLWFLGKSFELLSQADIVMFGKGWEKARGCKMEMEASRNYLVPNGVIVFYIDENETVVREV